jgi:hypothetical protein
MFLDNVNFKGHMLISLRTGILRTAEVQIVGYRERDLTWWIGWCSFAAQSLIAMGLFVLGRYMLGTKDTTMHAEESIEKVKAEEVEVEGSI